MASLEPDSFDLPAIGKQVMSQRTNAAHYSISKCGRKQREKVFISKEASNSVLAADTPGAIYNIPPTLNLNSGVSFGTGPQMSGSLDVGKKYPESSIDIMRLTVDNQKNKYPSYPNATFGTDPIGKMNNINLLKNHKAAFVGKESPGPQYDIRGEKGIYRRKFKGNLAWSVPFATKWNKKQWKSAAADVDFCTPMVSLGPQALSQRKNPAIVKFSVSAHPRDRKKRKDAEGLPTNINLSSFGRQIRHNKPTEPSVGFGLSTRKQAQQMTRAMTELDKPRAMGKVQLYHPTLPQERNVISYSGSQAAFM